MFLRAPDGSAEQLTDVSNLRIEALSDRGEVMVSRPGRFDRTAGTSLEHRLLTSDDTFVDSTSTGTPLFIGGRAHMAVAGGLFRITTTGDCDGGTEQTDLDSGLADGGLAEGGADDAGEADADDAASDAPDEPEPDADAPAKVDGSPSHEQDAAEEEQEADASEPETIDADAPSEHDAETAKPDAGRWRKRYHGADCTVSAPGGSAQRTGRPALASFGLLFALASWKCTRGRRRAAR